MCACADDLLISSKLLQAIVGYLFKNNFNLNWFRPISYHLGCDFIRDGNNDLCLAPREHI